MFVAADIMLVTPLRDGMNLVAKEYVSCRNDLGGALVLSAFTGAWHELHQAFICNPHDIEGVKQTIMRAINTPEDERRRRMKAMRKRVADHDVQRWASRYLEALASAPSVPHRSTRPITRQRPGAERDDMGQPLVGRQSFRGDRQVSEVGQEARIALRAFASRPRVLVAVDFDGTLAPLVTDPLQAKAVPGGLESLRDAATLGGVTTAVVSGRDLATLERLTAIGPDDGITLIGSHGAQTNRADRTALGLDRRGRLPDRAAAALLETLSDELETIRSRYPAVRLEHKPAAVALHTRTSSRRRRRQPPRPPARRADAMRACTSSPARRSSNCRCPRRTRAAPWPTWHSRRGRTRRSTSGTTRRMSEYSPPCSPCRAT